MRRQTRPTVGWHPEDIKAAIRKKDVTLSELGRRHKFSAAYLRNTLIRPLYRGEQIIAKFLGVPAHMIWPARYHADGTPKYRRHKSPTKRRSPT